MTLILQIFVTFIAFILTILVVLANLMRDGPGRFIGGSVLLFAWCCAALVWMSGSGRAHDVHHPEYDHWYQSLMQPDNPSASCCGKADAYWCDEYYARGGKAYCKITDDRPDGPLGRPHIPVGTEIEIPNHKLKFDRGNPTGHNVVFVSRALYVHCFVQGSGS